jgi:hypothetical protein
MEDLSRDGNKKVVHIEGSIKVSWSAETALREVRYACIVSGCVSRR